MDSLLLPQDERSGIMINVAFIYGMSMHVMLPWISFNLSAKTPQMGYHPSSDVGTQHSLVQITCIKFKSVPLTIDWWQLKGGKG